MPLLLFRPSSRILEGPMITVIVRSGMQISPGHSRSMIGGMGYWYRLISAGGVRDESV